MANKENIRKWVEALRSGRFQQTRGKLRGVDGYCCLGVACEVAIESGVKLTIAESHAADKDEIDYSYDGDYGSLPTSVSAWLGLFEEDDYGQDFPLDDPDLLAPGKPRKSATVLNDTEKQSFAEIADRIEFTYLREELAGDSGGTELI